MNKRLLLNIIIFSILTFYFIFGITYRQLFEDQAPDLAERSPWEQPFLIPKGWTLERIEFPNQTLAKTDIEQWHFIGHEVTEQAKLIADNWSGLMIQERDQYIDLPSGKTILVFVAELQEPIVYRMLIDAEQMSLYRMHDKRVFSLPVELQNVIWVN